jgi:peptidoglycan L-alanyl-D-glutamate endopeptidase CwlK
MTLYRPERLEQCDPDLIAVITSVAVDRDVLAIQGARTLAEEQADIAAGRSKLKNPLDSLHVTDPTLRPLALAADIAPYPLNWDDVTGFNNLSFAMKRAAQLLGIGLVWGGDWITFKDRDHYQLVHPHVRPT